MGSESEILVLPCLDFGKGGMTLEAGSEEWKEMSMKVREACESYGCFILKYDDMSIKGVREFIFKDLKPLFELPEETKQKHKHSTPFNSYTNMTLGNLSYQTFGINQVTIDNFTNIMWPQGNPSFCEALKGMSLKMSEINSYLLKMIMEGYGPQHSVDLESMKCGTYVRFNKYIVSGNGGDEKAKRFAHTDRNSLTILCDNGVQALQVLSKTGKWIEVNIPQDGFVVIIGDALKAWSNGRLHSPTHKVEMSGDRYSFGVFTAPNSEVMIEPRELVDDKLYPLRYRAFDYGKFMSYCTSNITPDAVDVFAGI